MGFQVREDGGPRRAVGRDVLGGVPAAEQRGDGRHIQVKNRVGFLELDVHVRQHRTELGEVTDVEVYLLYAFADRLPALSIFQKSATSELSLASSFWLRMPLMQVSSIWVVERQVQHGFQRTESSQRNHPVAKDTVVNLFILHPDGQLVLGDAVEGCEVLLKRGHGI